MAIYNSSAAVYRSLGKTNVTMYLSVASNIINVIGNLIGVFVLHAGVTDFEDCRSEWASYQIAANGVAQGIWSLAALAGVAMGPETK